jgi:soluble lytic murein transglycosylase-like protein
LFVPSVALDIGCLKLASLLKWSDGNVDAALAAYNGGRVGNAKPPYRNASYVNKVRAALLQVKHGR